MKSIIDLCQIFNTKCVIWLYVHTFPVSILLVGVGRIGVSHLSIMSGLLQPNLIEVHIVDSSFASRMIPKELVTDAKVFKGLEKVRIH
jgi:hypothetical protein